MRDCLLRVRDDRVRRPALHHPRHPRGRRAAHGGGHRVHLPPGEGGRHPRRRKGRRLREGALRDVLLVFVQERPAIATIEIEGAKEFTKENLKDGLKQAGISEAKIYDKSLLDRAEKELKRQYTGKGYYAAKVTTTVTPLERNRVSLRFDIEEGAVTKIADINIIGAKDFSERELLRNMKLTTPGWFTWFTKND